ncbi:MAG: hypothetical protein HWE25_09195 [Alphaproteobacteria bacterium]|nr:hypothetical protein [Alphaproteobacteria bacterium]
MLNGSKKLIAGVALAVAGLSVGANAQTLYMQKNRNMERGMEAMMAGDLEGASRYLARAAKADLGKPRLLPVLNNLCAVDYALGKLDSAEEACTRAIAEDRFFWRAYVNRGNVFKAQGRFEDAQADYAKAGRLKPESSLPGKALARLKEEQPKLFADAR